MAKSNGSQLDQSISGDWGNGDSRGRSQSESNVPSNLPGPLNLGGLVGQLEGGFPIGFPVAPISTNMDNTFLFPSSPSANSQQGAVEKTDGQFVANISDSL